MFRPGDLDTGTTEPIDAPFGLALLYGGPEKAIWSQDGHDVFLVNTFLPLENTEESERQFRIQRPCVTLFDRDSHRATCIATIKQTSREPNGVAMTLFTSTRHFGDVWPALPSRTARSSEVALSICPLVLSIFLLPRGSRAGSLQLALSAAKVVLSGASEEPSSTSALPDFLLQVFIVQFEQGVQGIALGYGLTHLPVNGPILAPWIDRHP